MARPKNIQNRGTVNHIFDLDIYREFVELVGAGNVSEELRAMIKDRVEQSKKEDGLMRPNPLNLKSLQDNTGQHNNRQQTIFEFIEVRDIRNELCKYMSEKDDMVHLETLYRNCNTVVKVIETKKRRNQVMGEVQRKAGIQANEEIIADIKRAKRWLPL